MVPIPADFRPASLDLYHAIDVLYSLALTLLCVELYR